MLESSRSLGSSLSREPASLKATLSNLESAKISLLIQIRRIVIAAERLETVLINKQEESLGREIMRHVKT